LKHRYVRTEAAKLNVESRSLIVVPRNYEIEISDTIVIYNTT